MESFSRFMYLPWELRSHIWKLSMEPRDIHIELLSSTEAIWRSRSKPPTLLHVCQESRRHLIEKYYTCDFWGPRDDVSPRDAKCRQYAWTNFELDRIWVNQEILHLLGNELPRLGVRHLIINCGMVVSNFLIVTYFRSHLDHLPMFAGLRSVLLGIDIRLRNLSWKREALSIVALCYDLCLQLTDADIRIVTTSCREPEIWEGDLLYAFMRQLKLDEPLVKATLRLPSDVKRRHLPNLEGYKARHGWEEIVGEARRIDGVGQKYLDWRTV